MGSPILNSWRLSGRPLFVESSWTSISGSILFLVFGVFCSSSLQAEPSSTTEVIVDRSEEAVEKPVVPAKPRPSKFHEKKLPSGLGFLDGVVGSALTPDVAYSLVEMGLGEVAKAEAFSLDFNQIVSINKSSLEQEKWVIAAPFYPPNDHLEYLYSIFLRELAGAFAGTPVVARTGESLKGRSRSIAELQEAVRRERKKLFKTVSEIGEKDLEISKMKTKVETMAEVENIIFLENQLEYFAREKEKAVSERKRLEKLVARGRKQVADKSLPALRRGLQAQLRDAAKVTANADRLSARKKRSAVGKVRSQMAMIRAAKGVNKKALLKKLRKVRAQRKTIEAQKGIRLETSEEF